MAASEFRYGFRILGGCFQTRRLVDAAAALSAYAAVDPRCEPDRESYLSAFWFDETFRRHLDETGSTAGYAGPCWSPWLWFDLDGEELHYAYKDAAALAVFLVERFAVKPAELLIFFSGAKGFHIGVPTALWMPAASLDFHRVCRRLAENAAALAAVTIDTGVYDRVRAFRAPNSTHPKTGLHKRRLTLDELTGLPLEKIVELSREPAAFELPKPPGRNDQAAADWQAAADQVARENEAKAARRAAGNGSPTLNRSTLEFIRDGVGKGDRHRMLFSAAANLGEFGCSPALAVALLEESALDSGLPPKDIRRGIECGLAAVPSALSTESTQQGPPESTPTTSDDSTVKKPPEAATGDSGSPKGQSCQPLTGATDSPPATIQTALAQLWQSTPAPDALPMLPEPYKPLPPGAATTGKLDTPCRCGSTEYVDVAISEGRTRRDCRRCGRFLGWGRWYGETDGGTS